MKFNSIGYNQGGYVMYQMLTFDTSRSSLKLSVDNEKRLILNIAVPTMQQKCRTDMDVRVTHQKQVFVKKLADKKLTWTSISCRAFVHGINFLKPDTANAKQETAARTAIANVFAR